MKKQSAKIEQFISGLHRFIKDRVEAAYKRTDLFEKRRVLMHAWGQFCMGKK
jgi:hypothetical protein